MAGTITLSNVLDQVTNQNYDINNAETGINAAYDDAKQANVDRSQAVLAAGGDQATVARTEEQGMLAAQNNSRNVASALGTNAEAASYKMIDLADQISRSYDYANQQLDVIHAKNSVSPITDGPIKYLAAQLSVKDDYENYNYAAQKHNIAMDEMGTLNELTQTSTRTQYAIAATRDAATVQAKSDAELQKANDVAAQIRAQNAMYDVDKLKTITALNGQELDNNFKAFNAINAEDQRAFMNEQRLAARADADARLKLAQESKADFAETARVVDLGSRSLGFTGVTPDRLRQALKMGGSTAESMRQFYLTGSVRDATGNVVIGGNAGEAARTIIDTQAPLVAAKLPVKDFVTTALSDVVSGKIPGLTLKPGDTAGIDAAVQSHVNTTALAQLSNIKAGDATNIYQAPDVQTVAKNSVAVAESTFYQKVLRPMAATVPTMESDPQRIMDIGLQAVKEGKIGFDEAVNGIATFYRGATIVNRATKGYSDMHVPEPDMSNPYRTRLAPVMGHTNQYNLSDPKDIVRYMTLRQIAGEYPYNAPVQQLMYGATKAANVITGQ